MYIYSCVLFNKQFNLYLLILLLHSHVFQIDEFFFSILLLKRIQLFLRGNQEMFSQRKIIFTLCSVVYFILSKSIHYTFYMKP